MATVALVCVNHMNVVLENFDASVKHFQKRYGAEFVGFGAWPLHASGRGQPGDHL
jgi:hypothetical protein